MRTKRFHCLLTLTALAFLPAILSGCASARPAATPAPPAHPTDDKPFDLPSLRLPSPADAAHLSYLGVGADDTFALADIRTRILVIEVFNFYCPHCQAEAPNINRLYQEIERHAQLRGQIKIIGIGIGNTPYEVCPFRKRYAVPFPLFADRSRVLAKQLEVRQTPTFIAWGYHPDGRIHPFLFAPGPIGDVEGFLKRLVHDSGLDLTPG